MNQDQSHGNFGNGLRNPTPLESLKRERDELIQKLAKIDEDIYYDELIQKLAKIDEDIYYHENYQQFAQQNQNRKL